jgi:hypothetical protein
MRPHKINALGILAPDMAAALYVKRDTTTNFWRLAWMVPGSDSFCYAEGECSAKLFRLRRNAIAYGVKAYGETARRWPC